MINPFICFVGGPLQGPSFFALSYHGLHPWLLMVCPFGAMFQMALFAYAVSRVLSISASRATQRDTHRCPARLWVRTSLLKGGNGGILNANRYKKLDVAMHLSRAHRSSARVTTRPRRQAPIAHATDTTRL
jgi:hypothetical protein